MDQNRRTFVKGLSCVGALVGGRGAVAAESLKCEAAGNCHSLTLDYQAVNFTGRTAVATAINGSVPGPLMRWREGDRVRVVVRNNLQTSSSIHWHGIILPTDMDGVPGLSYAGIAPGATYTYEFDLRQSGTYWYHSHSGFQEQTGLAGPIVIEPREPDPFEYDREYVVMLTDWSDEDPESIYAKLKKHSSYYNFHERTAADLLRDIREKGVAQTYRDRQMWNRMRMSDSDIADVTGHTYTYLMNGQTPGAGWKGLFRKGEKIRLRVINASAMSIFDFRIPGLKMRIVAADGQNVHPVSVDEFRIGVAETYDLIVEPDSEQAYCLFAQSIDRSGYARGSLTPHQDLEAEVPMMDAVPVLTHADMGMAMKHGAKADSSMNMDHDAHKGMSMNMDGDMNMDMDMNASESVSALGRAGFGSSSKIIHSASEKGPQLDMRAMMPASGLNDPGLGLRNHRQKYGRRVMNYGDLCGFHPTRDRREPSREIQLHLTGNMDRYMWSFDGIKYADAEPIRLQHGERVRIFLVNDTMMTHPIHLHGLWSELETGYPDNIPRKHTVLVQPGSTISYLVSADSPGRWAYHCHLLYHMAGMMREVRVSV